MAYPRQFMGEHHYLFLSGDNMVIAGPMSSNEVVAIIDSMPKPGAYRFSNASRYWLAKENFYKNNKLGNNALVQDVINNKPIYDEIVSGTYQYLD